MPKQTIYADDLTPEILVYGFMDNDMALDFVKQLKSHAGVCKRVKCRVNSEGGSVFAGIAMYNAVRQAIAQGCEVDMYIDGICASMASCFVCAGSKVYISRYAQVMTHKPSCYGGGNAEDLKELAEQVEAMEPVMADMYANKTGLTREEVTATFLKDKDTFFNSRQAIAAKLADEEYDGPEVSVPRNGDKKAVFAAYASLTILNKNPDTSMKQISAALWAKICAHLGITDSVDDAQFEAAIKKTIADAGKLAGIQAKLDAAEQKAKDLEKETVTKEVTAMLSNAFTAKKINAEQKALMAEQYADDPEGLKKLLATMGAFVSVTSQLIQSEKEGVHTPEVQALMAKGYDTLMKNGEMAQLKAASNDAYLELFKKHYGHLPGEGAKPKR